MNWLASRWMQKNVSRRLCQICVIRGGGGQNSDSSSLVYSAVASWAPVQPSLYLDGWLIMWPRNITYVPDIILWNCHKPAGRYFSMFLLLLLLRELLPIFKQLFNYFLKLFRNTGEAITIGWANEVSSTREKQIIYIVPSLTLLAPN